MWLLPDSWNDNRDRHCKLPGKAHILLIIWLRFRFRSKKDCNAIPRRPSWETDSYDWQHAADSLRLWKNCRVTHTLSLTGDKAEGTMLERREANRRWLGARVAISSSQGLDQSTHASASSDEAGRTRVKRGQGTRWGEMQLRIAVFV